VEEDFLRVEEAEDHTVGDDTLLDFDVVQWGLGEGDHPLGGDLDLRFEGDLHLHVVDRRRADEVQPGVADLVHLREVDLHRVEEGVPIGRKEAGRVLEVIVLAEVIQAGQNQDHDQNHEVDQKTKTTINQDQKTKRKSDQKTKRKRKSDQNRVNGLIKINRKID